MRYTLAAAMSALFATPALAAKGPFFSLKNTDFVVLLGLLVFIGILVYFKVPSLIMGMLDKRADDIKSELDEARKLREDAQTLLASYERKQIVLLLPPRTRRPQLVIRRKLIWRNR